MNRNILEEIKKRGKTKKGKHKIVDSVGFEPTQTEAYHGLNVTP